MKNIETSATYGTSTVYMVNGSVVSETDTRDYNHIGRSCVATTKVRYWTKALIPAQCGLIRDHEGHHKTNLLSVNINGRVSRISFR